MNPCGDEPLSPFKCPKKPVDPHILAKYWYTSKDMALVIGKRIRDVSRFRDIVAVLARYGFGQVIDLLDLEERAIVRALVKERKGAQLDAPSRFAKVLEELGPTFIKLGQILSTRPDLLPDNWSQALQRLQDQVKPTDGDEIVGTIETELGDSIENLFSSFNRTPVAAASVAQVHEAFLKDGTRVAVKVIRPGIRNIIDSDMDILYVLAALSSRLPEAKIFNPRAAIQELDRAIHQELDLTRELLHIQRFKKNFEAMDWIVVPTPYSEFCGRSVLTTQFIDGVKFTNYEAVNCDRVILAQRGVACVLKMAFEDGFFHADPHPGNVLALTDNRIALLDTGMTGSLDRTARERIVGFLEAMIQDEPDKIAEALFAIGETSGPVDFSKFRRDVLHVYEDQLRGRSIQHVRIASVIKSFFEIANKHHLVVPSDYTLLIKALVTIEGVAKEIYPELDIFEEAKPYVTRLMLERYKPERITSDITDVLRATHSLMTNLPRRIDMLLGDLEQGRVTVRMEDAKLEIKAAVWEHVARRLALGLVASGTAVGGAILMDNHPILGLMAWSISFLSAFLAATGLPRRRRK